MQNKCLRMILNAPYDTRIADLHREINYTKPTIRKTVDEVIEKFDLKTCHHDNLLVKNLKIDSSSSIKFRVKHTHKSDHLI